MKTIYENLRRMVASAAKENRCCICIPLCDIDYLIDSITNEYNKGYIDGCQDDSAIEIIEKHVKNYEQRYKS